MAAYTIIVDREVARNFNGCTGHTTWKWETSICQYTKDITSTELNDSKVSCPDLFLVTSGVSCKTVEYASLVVLAGLYLKCLADSIVIICCDIIVLCSSFTTSIDIADIIGSKCSTELVTYLMGITVHIVINWFVWSLGGNHGNGGRGSRDDGGVLDSETGARWRTIGSSKGFHQEEASHPIRWTLETTIDI